MKRIFNTALFILAVFNFLFLSRIDAASELPVADLPLPGKLLIPEEAQADPKISLDFQDANLNDLLKLFSIQSGLNFIAASGVQERKITLYLDNVPLDKAMDKLFKANNLGYELDKEANIFVVKDLGRAMVETTTKVFRLKYASVSNSKMSQELNTALGGSGGGVCAVTEAAKKMLTENGSIIEDYRTNSLIVTDIPSRMPVISSIITALDISVPAVMLEVEMLDVSKSNVDKIGLKFGQTPLTLASTMTPGSWGTKFPFESIFGKDTSNFTAGTIKFGASNYQVALDFLTTCTDTKYLARPRIMTLNNETAELKITTQETVGTTTSTTGGTSAETQVTGQAERQETGVTLRVTPQINPDTGEITMFIMPTVKDTSTSTFLIANSTSQHFKDPEERSTRSIVRVKDGDTVIIGGLLRKQKTETITKLPFFGDIPLIGGIFRNRDKDLDRDRELLVFITPRIIKDAAMKLAQAKNAMLSEREQDVLSGPNREAIIRGSLESFERKKR